MKKKWIVIGFGMIAVLAVVFVTTMSSKRPPEAKTVGEQPSSSAEFKTSTSKSQGSVLSSQISKQSPADPESETKDEQQTSASLPEILSKVREMTLPKASYAVQVEQTVTQIGQAATKGNIVPAEIHVVVDDSGFHLQPSPSSTDDSKDPAGHASASIQVVLDPAQTLQEMLTWDVEIESSDYSGHPCYQISGNGDGPLSAVVLVDREKWCVYSIVVNMNEQTVIEASAEHEQHASGIWLPSSVVIDHPTEGLQIAQEFGEYMLTE